MAIWETLDSQYLWQSHWYNLRQDRLRTPDGREFTYTLVDHPGAVWIVPVTADGQVALVWQYRHTVDDWCYEVPAGGLSPGLTPEEVARRELLEEVGGDGRRAALRRPVLHLQRHLQRSGLCLSRHRRRAGRDPSRADGTDGDAPGAGRGGAAHGPRGRDHRRPQRVGAAVV